MQGTQTKNIYFSGLQSKKLIEQEQTLAILLTVVPAT